MKRVNAALIGSGHIGTDLLIKMMRSEALRPVWMVGIDEDSEGLALARRLGLKTTAEGIGELLPHLMQDEVRIAFDATSARSHDIHARELRKHNVMVIDLTPAAIGPYCVPPVNLGEHLIKQVMNINMVSCGGQATIPIVAAIARVQPVAYAEIIATVASRSAGPGTRKNIDEFTRTTADGICKVGGARDGKAIIILNPAEPPLNMRDTVHCLTDSAPNETSITESVKSMVSEVQRYVPGYALKNGPVFEGNRVSVFLEVTGLGDHLPTYAGNLDIMTASALQTGERIARAWAAPSSGALV